MTEGIVLISNARFFPGVVATLNSLKLTNPQYPICFIDQGVTEEQHEIIKKRVDKIIKMDINDRIKGRVKFWQGKWMTDFSCFSQIFQAACGYDTILSLEVDTLVLGDLSPMFEKAKTNKIVGVMDDGVKSCQTEGYIWPIKPQLFNWTSFVADYPNINLDEYMTMNGGVFITQKETFKEMEESWDILLKYGPHYAFLAQTYINLFLLINGIKFYNMGPQYNLSGLNEIESFFDINEIEIKDEGQIKKFFYKNKEIFIPHFTGEYKAWIKPEVENKLFNLWRHYYNNGILF